MRPRATVPALPATSGRSRSLIVARLRDVKALGVRGMLKGCRIVAGCALHGSLPLRGVRADRRSPRAACAHHANGVIETAVPTISVVRTSAPTSETATRRNDW